MLVLGIETSCDDTAAAVLEDGTRLLANIIYDQTAVHSRYGGVVPELAGRSHIEKIHHAVESVIQSAGIGLDELQKLQYRNPALCDFRGVLVEVLSGLYHAGAGVLGSEPGRDAEGHRQHQREPCRGPEPGAGSTLRLS